MTPNRDDLKRAAAMRAIEEVEDGMVLGLGTGSTAAFVVEGLARRVAAGLRVVGIPTSERTAAQARRLGVRIATFAEYQSLDLTIDGADEVELGSLDLIKGLGGALLREKIVAAASRRLVIVVDQEKLVERLGEHTPVPVEVTQFGWQATQLNFIGNLRCSRPTPACAELLNITTNAIQRAGPMSSIQPRMAAKRARADVRSEMQAHKDSALNIVAGFD